MQACHLNRLEQYSTADTMHRPTMMPTPHTVTCGSIHKPQMAIGHRGIMCTQSQSSWVSLAPANSASHRPAVAAAAKKAASPADSEPGQTPARGKSASKPQQRDTGDEAPNKPPPRAPKAQRQLFGALAAMRGGQPAAPSTGGSSSSSTGSTKPKGGFGRKAAGKQQASGSPRSRGKSPNSWDDFTDQGGPPDVVVLGRADSKPAEPTSTKPKPAPFATTTAAVAAGAAAVAATRGAPRAPAKAPAPSQPAGKQPDDDEDDEGEEPKWNVRPEDGEDGAQVWRDKLAEVGWGYDDDQDEDEDEDEDEMADEDEDLEGDLELEQALVEVDAYGAWFAGEGEQPEESPQEKVLRQGYTDKAYVWPASWGSVKATMLAGRGRAITAVSKLEAGDLIMVSRPVGMLEYDADEGEDSAPENEELADVMMKRARLTPAQHLWVSELLMSQAPPASQGTDAQEFTFPRLPTQEELQALRKPTGTTTPLQITDQEGKQRMYRLVNLNVLGEEFKELAASSLRQQDAPGYLGVWPDAALINHSCAPNATYWVLGDRLVVRATEEVLPGQEVTISYLGALLTAPLPVRRAELQDKWGFKCGCARCKAEEKVAGEGTELGTLMTELHQWCKDLNEVLSNALEDEDYEEVADIKLDLIQRKDEFEAALRAAKVSSKARRWLQASVYDLYDMLSLCADEDNSASEASSKGRGGKSPKGGAAPDGLLDTENLAVCARILECVSRGTDAQAYLAAEYMVRAGVRFGAQHHEALEAKKLCRNAFIARFGPVSDSMLDQLIAARLDD